MFTILLGSIVFGQDSGITDTFNPNQWNKLFVEKGAEKVNQKLVYPVPDYVNAVVPLYKLHTKLIYNALNDEFEYVHEDGVIYTITKKNGLTVEFSDGRNYVYSKYYNNTEEKEGFLQLLSDPKQAIKLFKKNVVTEIAVDKNGYNTTSGVSHTTDTKYYVLLDKKIVYLPNSVSKIDKELGLDIKSIVKNGNISLKKEEDLIRLFTVLNK